MIAYYSVKEGRSYYNRRPGRPSRRGASTIVNAEGQSRLAITLSQVIASIRTNERPTIYFLCLGNP